MASRQIPDISLDEFETCPLLPADTGLHLTEVAPVTRCKIVQSHNLLVELQQCLDEIGPYEAGCAGHQPPLRRVLEVCLCCLIGFVHGHSSRLISV
jgi:hypothetical protein